MQSEQIFRKCEPVLLRGQCWLLRALKIDRWSYCLQTEHSVISRSFLNVRCDLHNDQSCQLSGIVQKLSKEVTQSVLRFFDCFRFLSFWLICVQQFSTLRICLRILSWNHLILNFFYNLTQKMVTTNLWLFLWKK